MSMHDVKEHIWYAYHGLSKCDEYKVMPPTLSSFVLAWYKTLLDVDKDILSKLPEEEVEIIMAAYNFELNIHKEAMKQSQADIDQIVNNNYTIKKLKDDIKHQNKVINMIKNLGLKKSKK